MLFLVGHDRQTYAIDLEAYRSADGDHTYVFDHLFSDLRARLFPLSSLEEAMPDIDKVWRVKIGASPNMSGGGVLIKPESFEPIREPLPRRKQRAEDGIEDDGEETEVDNVGVVSDDDVSSEGVVGRWVDGNSNSNGSFL